MQYYNYICVTFRLFQYLAFEPEFFLHPPPTLTAPKPQSSYSMREKHCQFLSSKLNELNSFIHSFIHSLIYLFIHLSFHLGRLINNSHSYVIYPPTSSTFLQTPRYLFFYQTAILFIMTLTPCCPRVFDPFYV